MNSGPNDSNVDDSMIPCDVCGRLVPFSDYVVHRMICDRGTLRLPQPRVPGITIPYSNPRRPLLQFGLTPLFDISTEYVYGYDEDGDEDGDDYERNLALQDRIGSVKKAIKDLSAVAPVVTEHSLDKCSICLSDSAAENKPIRRTVCGHEFCAECIEKWLSEHTTCPMCVNDMSKEGGYVYVMDPNNHGSDEVTTRRPGIGFGEASGSGSTIFNDLTFSQIVAVDSPQVSDNFGSMLYHLENIREILARANARTSSNY